MKYTILDKGVSEDRRMRTEKIMSRRTARHFGEKHQSDNRRHTRNEMDLEVVIYHGGETFNGVLANLSEGGVLLECEKEFMIDSEVCLEIKAEDGGLLESYVGKVVRVEDLPSWFPRVAIVFDMDNPHPEGGACSV